MPEDAIAGLWLRFSDLAARPPHEDAAAVQTAVAAAKAVGAADELVRPLQARGLLLEASELLAKDDTRSAVAKALEASALEPEASAVALGQFGNAALRAADDWDRVVPIAAAAGALDENASGWAGEAIAKHPRGLSAVPPEVLGRLPAATIARLQPAVVTALRPVRNSIGIELKLLPAGTFTMGQRGGDSAETTHQVTLTRPFYIGVHEVTNAQWKRVMGGVPSSWKDDERPVESVSWEEAAEYCRKLSALPEEQKAGRVYRLPTEAEWEYACRAGTDTSYSFGDDESKLGDYGWFKGNSGNQTPPVGQKKPNAWGLFDMHGNVNEWCSDWYGDYPKRAVIDPQGPSRGSGRVKRGGLAGHSRSAGRSWNDPSTRSNSLGFRPALSPPRGPGRMRPVEADK